MSRSPDRPGPDRPGDAAPDAPDAPPAPRAANALDAPVPDAPQTPRAPSYQTSAFDYTLPPELIARHPAERRDESRLLVVDRARRTFQDHIFRELPAFISPGDAVVLNETRVFPARLVGRRPGGGEAEVFLLTAVDGETARQRDGASRAAEAAGAPETARHSQSRTPAVPQSVLWRALVRPGSKLRPGKTVEVGEDLRVHIVGVEPDGTRLVELETPLPLDVALERYGRVPLPPYIDREPEPEDVARYQTVYARERGSVAAPTAGLHFTPAVLQALEAGGVELVRLVLHVGVGTFRPVEVEDPAAHRMHAEWYRVPPAAAAALNAVRERGDRIWAVGTTVARTLETVADETGRVHPGEGWTDIFLRPPYRFRAVGGLLTNFHLPRSTLLMLVAALADRELVLAAYRHAIAARYRFYSYGDAMLIL